MELRLRRIEQRVGAQTHLYPLDLSLVPLAVTVLLGATQAGKTTLMRLMAGLDKPSATVVTRTLVAPDDPGLTRPMLDFVADTIGETLAGTTLRMSA